MTDLARPLSPAPLSAWGERMSAMTGIRSIMDDIAAASGGTAAEQWINLSPGNPALLPESVAMWRRLARGALDSGFESASSRYGPSRGSGELVDAICEYFRRTYGWSITDRNVVVGPGAQMLCYLGASAYTDAGARPLVLPMLPDYAGYFGLSPGRGTVGVPAEVVTLGERSFRYRLDLDAIAEQRAVGCFLVSSPANPTGNCLTPDERAALVGDAESRGVPLIIDHAYGEPFPRVAGTREAPVQHPNVINCFTFSKAGIPGERIAFAVGPPELISPLVAATANVALHAPGLMQLAAAAALRTDALDVVVRESIQPFYRHRRALAAGLLDEHLPQSVAWRLHEGVGGMFLWLWIDEASFDDLHEYEVLKQQRVLVVPGRHFFARASRTTRHMQQCVRLSIGGDIAELEIGIRALGRSLTGGPS